jgi:hypothetical protein
MAVRNHGTRPIDSISIAYHLPRYSKDLSLAMFVQSLQPHAIPQEAGVFQPLSIVINNMSGKVTSLKNPRQKLTTNSPFSFLLIRKFRHSSCSSSILEELLLTSLCLCHRLSILWMEYPRSASSPGALARKL